MSPRRPLLRFAALALSVPLAACAATPAPYGTSLLGEPLVNAPLDPDRRAALEADLASAAAAARERPNSEEAIIWHGRRLAYLARYEEAIAVFTAGLERHPDSHRLLRHRGHRYITTRRFGRAIEDLRRAEELSRLVPDAVEPDGAPNARGIPLGTDRGNILYHLGLAQYLAGDMDAAAATFGRRAALDANADNRASTAYWRYLALRRAGRAADARAALAAVDADAEVLENHAYRDLVLLFRGERGYDELDARLAGPQDPSRAALAYGLGAWHLVEGRATIARARFEALVADRTRMDAFGYIAAEAELAREVAFEASVEGAVEGAVERAATQL